RAPTARDPYPRGSESVDLAVRGDQCRFTLCTINRLAVFHPDNAGKSFPVNVLEHAPVVDLAGSRFVPSRHVAYLEICNLVPGSVDVRDDIALGDLLVIHVEQDLAGGAVDRFADHVGLWYFGEKHAGMIEEVQRFQHHDEAMRLENRA